MVRYDYGMITTIMASKLAHIIITQLRTVVHLVVNQGRRHKLRSQHARGDDIYLLVAGNEREREDGEALQGWKKMQRAHVKWFESEIESYRADLSFI
jgi:hypothetical protein